MSLYPRAHGLTGAVHWRGELVDPVVAVRSLQPDPWRAASGDLVASVPGVEADSPSSFLRQLYRAGTLSPAQTNPNTHTDRDKQRYEQIFSTEEKDTFLASWGLTNVNLDGFRQIFGSTPFFTAGGYNDQNAWGVLESGRYDAILFGRPFTSNPDLVNRLRKGIPLTPYERSRFYGPFEDNKLCYVDYEPAQEA